MFGDGSTKGRSQPVACSSRSSPATPSTRRASAGSPSTSARQATISPSVSACRTGIGLEPDEGAVLARLPAPLEARQVAAERVGTVEDEHADPGARARADGEHGGPDEGVVARADVLQVDDEQVEAGEVLGARGQLLEALAVEAADRGAERVARVRHADHVLRLAAVAVLGPEDEVDLHAQRVEDVARVHETAIDGGGVRQEADAQGAQLGAERGVGGEAIESGAHVGRGERQKNRKIRKEE